MVQTETNHKMYSVVLNTLRKKLTAFVCFNLDE
ncbi:hypothetical protein CLV81_3632 [Flagellimonas meridianipacifica]|uniref:Uncharacterized protein n=1 Tax=Flagellimonas meridianipacifica TaxID=1080225 RepID=A0A2T0MCL6_9FLAO|nr:hypothetical protein CLV81_3632 [Allomuricauda pacifica]